MELELLYISVPFTGVVLSQDFQYCNCLVVHSPYHILQNFLSVVQDEVSRKGRCRAAKDIAENPCDFTVKAAAWRYTCNPKVRLHMWPSYRYWHCHIHRMEQPVHTGCTLPMVKFWFQVIQPQKTQGSISSLQPSGCVLLLLPTVSPFELQ